MTKPKHETQSPPTTPSEQKGVTDGDLKRQVQDLGFLGKMFGSRDHSPSNIAGLAIIVAFLILVGILFAPDSLSLPKKDVFTLVSGIITLTLGFLFGRSTNS
jgi:high-affinity Fe2+/Pb2+ permease